MNVLIVLLLSTGLSLRPTDGVFPRVLWFFHLSPGVFGTSSFFFLLQGRTPSIRIPKFNSFEWSAMLRPLQITVWLFYLQAWDGWLVDPHCLNILHGNTL